ncbi:MAG: RNA-binding protein [Planctomycetes bacterium]|nr:RNA-binding protein [Planctomycetota bacterium]
MKNIYCGNLSYSCTEDELRQLFEQFGKVQSAKVIMDRDTGRARGFGFVEMEVESEADQAIESLNGTDFGGRNIIVNEARPRGERRARD